MARLKLNEAFARAEMNGKKVLKKDLGAKLWEGSKESAIQVRMTDLCNGTTKRVQVEDILIICEMLDCTPNFLFGYE